MARPRRVAIAVASIAVLALLDPGPASALRSLHVDALAMHVDKRTIHVGEVFHLAIHTHVRENVTALDELVVPDVGTMQLLGDERRVTHAGGGSDVVETLTLEPSAAGAYTFAGAYLDAIDARTKKPSRFSASPVSVVVSGPSAYSSETLRGAVTTLLLVLGGIVAVLFALVIALLTLRRRPQRPAAAPAVAPPPPRTARDEVAEALSAYRTTPALQALMRLRVALFGASGAGAGATLRDALGATLDHRLRGALIAAERAAFGPAYARDAASVELVDATEAWLA